MRSVAALVAFCLLGSARTVTAARIYFLQKIYLVGEHGNSTTSGKSWQLLKFDKSNGETLDVAEDPTLYTSQQLSKLLQCLDDGNKSTGGLRTIAERIPALIGCFRFSSHFYLLLVTKTRLLGRIGGVDVYGIDATALVPLGSPSETVPQAVATEEAECRKLLSLVTLTRDFFFSFSWPIWATVQQTFENNFDLNSAFSSDRVWTQHLAAPLRKALGHARWTVPLVHGFFAVKSLSLLGQQLTLTLVARRSSRFAGPRYLKRGIRMADGSVANDVEVEQILELGGGGTGAVTSVVQMRGSVPLFWSQAWDSSGAALRPSIRMLNHLDPFYDATAKHFRDLQQRYRGPVQCLDLLRHGDSRRQESLLSKEYQLAVAYLNRRRRPSQQQQQQLQQQPPLQIGYVHWDLRLHARAKGSTLLADLQAIQAPLLASTSLFSSSFGGRKINAQQVPVQLQRGVVRTNCVDCLDRTNVAQFAFGLLALGRQLQALGLVSSPHVDPQSSFAAELMAAYESMGNELAQQYGGSEAHSGFFQRWRGDWHATLQGRDLLTSIRRFYSNAVTDEDKQAAIDLFLGPFVMPPEKREEIASSQLFSAAGSSSGGGHGGDDVSEQHRQQHQQLVLSQQQEHHAQQRRGESNLSAESSFEGDGGRLPSSMSTASLSSELDSGASISLTEVLAAAGSGSLRSAGGNNGIGNDALPTTNALLRDGTTSTAAPGNGKSDRADEAPPSTGKKTEEQRRRWWHPSLSSSPSSSGAGAVAAVASSSAGAGSRRRLESMDDIVPKDIRHVRLTSGNTTTAAPSTRASPRPIKPLGTTTTTTTTATGGGRMHRSVSVGNNLSLPPSPSPLMTTSTTTSSNHRSLDGWSSGNNGGFTRSSRDLRGTFTFSGTGGITIGPGGSGNKLNATINEDDEAAQQGGSPVLPRGTGSYHMLAGLNLEGAPDMEMPRLTGDGLTTSTRIGEGGNINNITNQLRPSTAQPPSPFSKARRLSYASLAALKQLVRGKGGDGGGTIGSTSGDALKALSGEVSGSRPMSRSNSALTLAINENTTSNENTSGSSISSMRQQSSMAAHDLSWLLTKQQAVAHGLDDLGLPPHVAPLWRPGANVVACFAELQQRAAEQHAVRMAQLATPLGVAERRLAEREAATMLRPTIALTVPMVT